MVRPFQVWTRDDLSHPASGHGPRQAIHEGETMSDSHSQGSPFPTHTLANGLRIVAQPMGGVESLALGF